jgi:hypothetical protein
VKILCSWVAAGLSRTASLVEALPLMTNSITHSQAQELQECKALLAEHTAQHTADMSAAQQVGQTLFGFIAGRETLRKRLCHDAPAVSIDAAP